MMKFDELLSRLEALDFNELERLDSQEITISPLRQDLLNSLYAKYLTQKGISLSYYDPSLPPRTEFEREFSRHSNPLGAASLARKAVIINARSTETESTSTLLHELLHIAYGHLDNPLQPENDPIAEYEVCASAYLLSFDLCPELTNNYFLDIIEIAMGVSSFSAGSREDYVRQVGIESARQLNLRREIIENKTLEVHGEFAIIKDLPLDSSFHL